VREIRIQRQKVTRAALTIREVTSTPTTDTDFFTQGFGVIQ